MEVFEAIKGRRSVRNFSDEEISEEEIKRILEAGIWAPSGSNIQPWEFVLVRDPENLRRVKMVSPGMLGDPKAAVVICRNLLRAERAGKLGKILSLMDCAMAAQNMMLEAYSLGIGSCPIASFDDVALREILKLPDFVEPVLIISLGRPKEWPSPPPRRPLSEVLHLERYRGGPSLPAQLPDSFRKGYHKGALFVRIFQAYRRRL